jgi:hypothetical protein
MGFVQDFNARDLGAWPVRIPVNPVLVAMWAWRDASGGFGPKVRSAYRIWDGDEPRPVVEHGLDMNLGDDVGHAGQDVARSEHRAPGLHCLGVP